MAIVNSICEVCGEEFEWDDEKRRGMPRKYCIPGGTCAVKAHRQRKKQRTMELKNGK
jgi:hypothetical protein